MWLKRGFLGKKFDFYRQIAFIVTLTCRKAECSQLTLKIKTNNGEHFFKKQQFESEITVKY